MKTNLIPGFATREATERYTQTFGKNCAEGHYSDFINLHLKLSSIGLGTFPGAATDEVDGQYAEIISKGLQNGINVIDTGAHYRYGRSLGAVGMGLRKAFEAGVSREELFLVSKGGFLTFKEGPPQDMAAWFDAEIVKKNLGNLDDLTQAHLLNPRYIAFQLELSRQAMGVETLDAFLIDQPEVHIPRIGKEMLNKKLEQIFVVLEQAVKDGRIRYYGISTFSGFRVETDDKLFQSITSLQGLAERAAKIVQGDVMAKHHFKVVQMPFNQVMLEGFTRFSQTTGQGNIAGTFQAAHQLKVYLMASHTMFKGHLATQCTDTVLQSMSQLKNHAQRALQFNRSTPGLGTTLVGVSTPSHLEDVLEVAKMMPIEKTAYLKMYQRTE
ncbi:aldo/keto reductase [Sulfurirhabdus autotrophica]|uniref:Aryl-alcohol dehydrogenase-like predicted oxidoreductase n=1 Tax=Sulfurirhabdus autotrophica TaxID=1706046 RepID=A0A4R3YE44_9PROT|nr:aldo/keto reductase [Sulfurirhabdus autotrophica]TCV90320.1 aryl-alcohol dehydrogenase-like predicted oxidoreductase [Sulfurirhabdus autotrophica]